VQNSVVRSTEHKCRFREFAYTENSTNCIFYVCVCVYVCLCLCLSVWGDLGVDGWIILGWISRRWDVGMWTGLGWSRIGTGGVRL